MSAGDPVLLRAVLDGLSDEIALLDPGGRVVLANRPFAERAGLRDPSLALGRSPSELLPPDEARAVLGASSAIAGGAQAVPPRELRRSAPGADRWISVSAVPLTDGDGRARGALVVTRDVTRFRRIEEALRDSEAIYHSLVEQLPMNVFRKDAAGRFVFANALLCETLGMRREDVLGKTDHDFSPKPLADKYRTDDVRVMETGESFYDVEEHNPRGGEPTYIQVFKSPVRNAIGDTVGTQGFFVDITPLKRTEASLVRKTAELEEALRALRENQEQLLLAEKMASLGRLTAGIAHEMNTPLAAVRSALTTLDSLAAEYASSIGDGEVTGQDHREIAAEMAKTIRLAAVAAKRAAGFVQGVKAHTRDLGRREKERFNAVPVAEEALLLLTHALRRGSAGVSFQPEAPELELLGSPGRFAQIVTNLVTNAVEAAGTRPGMHVTVRLYREAGDALLAVDDDGPGIPADLVGKIFDPMFTTKRFGEGTGLGLTIVHDIVVGDFGGTIDVRTALGEGTTFLVRFPGAPPQE